MYKITTKQSITKEIHSISFPRSWLKQYYLSHNKVFLFYQNNASCHFKLFIEGNYEPLYVCNKYVITFLIKNKVIGFQNIDHVDTRDKFPI